MKKSISSKKLPLFLMVIIMTMTTILPIKVFAYSWKNITQQAMPSYNKNNISLVEDHVVDETSLFVDDPLIDVSLSGYVGKIDMTKDGSKLGVQCPPDTRYTFCVQQQTYNPKLPRCSMYNRDKMCNP